MEHWHAELIDDPQWVSCCVEKGCPFEDGRVPGSYVCRAHCSEHSCSGHSCALIHAMASRVPYGTSSESSCPVAELLTFRKEELEFRDPWAAGTRGPEASYGALGRAESGPGRGCRPSTEEELDAVALVLKSCLPAMIALFSTLLTDEFLREYEVADRGQAPVAGPQSWTARMFRAADRVRFGGRAELGLAGEWQASVRREATPGARGRGSRLPARASRGSSASPSSQKGRRATRRSLPLVVAVTLDEYVSRAASDGGASGMGTERLDDGLSNDTTAESTSSRGRSLAREVRPSTPLEADKPERGQRGSGRKRRTPCSSAATRGSRREVGGETMRCGRRPPTALGPTGRGTEGMRDARGRPRTDLRISGARLSVEGQFARRRVRSLLFVTLLNKMNR
ncbi:hypothetical protein Q5P01_000837 [Channa striata]|uniref:Uncharacterized protein n=1 Tax=Channa striata TaxID=64152 RepID=A0AA88IKJ7_CHASR|nr:hypothetical protein Q5P01_000837 [Channa striata]